jgi:hypothetical protein
MVIFALDPCLPRIRITRMHAVVDAWGFWAQHHRMYSEHCTLRRALRGFCTIGSAGGQPCVLHSLGVDTNTTLFYRFCTLYRTVVRQALQPLHRTRYNLQGGARVLAGMWGMRCGTVMSRSDKSMHDMVVVRGEWG